MSYWEEDQIGVRFFGDARVDSVYPDQKEVWDLLFPILEEEVKKIERKDKRKVTVIEVEERRIHFVAMTPLTEEEDSMLSCSGEFTYLSNELILKLQEIARPSRYDREVEPSEGTTQRPSTSRKPRKVEGLWAIQDRLGVTVSYCYSEASAKAVAAHSQHFKVEYVKGSFVIPEGDFELKSVGRFRKVLED